jgi:hypothetical protein
MYFNKISRLFIKIIEINHDYVQWVPGALFVGVKRPGRDAHHLPPSSAEVKEWVQLYFYSPNTPLWRSVELKKAQGQLYFNFTLWKSVCEDVHWIRLLQVLGNWTSIASRSVLRQSVVLLT